MSTGSDTCPACDHPLDDYRLGEKNGYALIACRNCGSVVAHPFPTQATLDEAFAGLTADDVFDDQRQLAKMQKLIPGLMAQTGGRRFLVPRAQLGYAVHVAKTLGLEAVGLETENFMADFALRKFPGIDIRRMSPQAYADTGAQADIIASLYSFSFCPDPAGLARALGSLLAPGGVLYVQEFDGNHIMLPKDLGQWPFANPPMNFFYPSKNGLKHLLEKNGLRVVKTAWSFQPILRFTVVKA